MNKIQTKHLSNWRHLRLVAIAVAGLLFAACCYKYLGPIGDRPLNQVKIGMSKKQVADLVGRPDWIEPQTDGSELWAFRAECGFKGYIFPYYISFSPNGFIDATAWS